MTVVEQLEAATKELAAAKETIAQHVAAIEARDKTIAAAKADAEAVAVSLKAYAEKALADKQALDAEIAAHAATKAELATAKKALENPAYAAAAATGDKAPVPEGGSAATVQPMTKAEALSEYNKLTDPKAREQYRKDHAKELELSAK